MSKKITDLTALTTPDPADVVPLVDVSISTTKKTTVAAIASQIPAGTVTNAMLATATGQPGGAWESWTPVWTNITVGNGTVVAKYKQVGETVFFRLGLLLGTTSVIGSNHTISLPVTSAAYINATNIPLFGSGVFFDSSASAYYTMSSGFVSTTTMRLYVNNAAGTYTLLNQMNATTPAAYGTSDEFIVQGFYEVA